MSVRAVGELTAAMGDRPRVTAVLLTASDAVTRRRLAGREIGSALRRHIERGIIVARELEEAAPDWVHRVDTGDRTVAGIAAEVIGLTGWMAER